MSCTMKAFVNAMELNVESTIVLQEGVLLTVLKCRNETMVWNKKYKNKVQPIQLKNLRSELGVRTDE